MGVPHDERPGDRVVLVTGVSRDLGRRSRACLAADPTVGRVIGVDVVPPRGDVGDVSFVRADIRNPVIAKVIAKENVDTVVHMSVISTPGSAGGRGTMKELNVIGTMQLLAACQKAPSVQHLVVKSTTTVYGASNRDPAMFTEDMEPRRAPRSGYAKDVAEIEGYVRGFARRRPDVRGHHAALRQRDRPPRGQPDHLVLPAPGDPDRARLRPPAAVPARAGPDGRPHHAVAHDVPGTFNVAGDGVLMLSQALRRLQRPTVPMPGFAVGQRRLRAAPARLADFSPEQLGFLTYGRGVDTTRMREELGFEPRSAPPRRSPTSPRGCTPDRRPGRAGARPRARPAARPVDDRRRCPARPVGVRRG